jgi:sugar phosphate isomerase/epimerase
MSKSPGVQLYTLRDHMAADRRATLHRLAGLGYGAVEVFEATEDPAGLRAIADDLGLTVCSAHSQKLLDTDPGAVFEAVATLGTDLAIVGSGLTEDAFAGSEAVKRTADVLNALADRAAEYGVKVGYHNYWWEFTSRIDDRHALEALSDLLIPEFFYEIDVYWAALGGADVPGVLTRFADRVPALHLKDGPIVRGAPHAALGRGAMPTARILAAAPATALRIVELQTCEGDIFEALADSREYLASLAGQS